MRRREFIIGMAGVAASPGMARAQSGSKDGRNDNRYDFGGLGLTE
jgi:hypothetical protein